MLSTHTLRTLIITVTGLGVLIELPAYGKKHQPLPPVSSYNQTRDDVVVHVEKVNKSASKKMFGKNLLSYGYQPLRVAIFNDSDDELLLRASAFQLPLCSAASVAEQVQTPIVAYLAAPAGLAAFFFWPLLVPVFGAGFLMSAGNQRASDRIQASIFEGDMAVEILPYERLEKVIFVDAVRADHPFSFYVFNVHKKSFIPFMVDFARA